MTSRARGTKALPNGVKVTPTALRTKKGGVDLLLKLPDRLAKRELGDIQMACRGSDTATLSHSDKLLQLAQSHTYLYTGWLSMAARFHLNGDLLPSYY